MDALLGAGIAIACFMLVLFVISLVRSDNSIADIGYGIAFIVGILTAVSVHGVYGPTWLIVLLPVLWGLRLAVRIFRRNWNRPEDFRYRAWRESWGKWFVVRSFFQIYVLQGTIIFLVALPVFLAIAFPREPYMLLVVLGVAVWVTGFFFEARGDYELDRFVAQPENKGKIMDQGLWRYSRHPNYFGESVMWWGIFILCCGLSNVPLWALISPALITYLLLFVSGVPMLEKRFAGNPAWEAYKAKTSVFIPLPPRA